MPKQMIPFSPDGRWLLGVGLIEGRVTWLWAVLTFLPTKSSLY